MRSRVPILLFICLNACGGGVPRAPSAGNGGEPAEIFVTGGERLGWTQEALSFQELTAFRHWVYVDGVREPLDAARCPHEQADGTYSCFSPLPRMTPGRHVLELTTTVTRGSQALESARSRPLVVIVAGGAEITASEQPSARPSAEAGRFIVEPVATGLNVPTAVVTIPDGSFLVGERRGTLKIVAPESSLIRVALDAGELNDVTDSDIVLHGVVLHPDFRRNAFVYLLYTERSPADEAVTRVARFRSVAGRLGERVILLDQVPARQVNPGGAIGFGPDGKLYVGTDDGSMPAGRSDPGVLAGKVLRLNDDGSAARDNPLPSPVIFAGLHRPVALGWRQGSDRPWLVDEALPSLEPSPEPSSDPLRGQVVSVHAVAGVFTACVYHGAKFPGLTGKVVFAQGDSLRYIDPDRPRGDDSDRLLKPGVGRIQVVGADEQGFLYVGTGNTGPHEDVGRDLLIRVGPRP